MQAILTYHADDAAAARVLAVLQASWMHQMLSQPQVHPGKRLPQLISLAMKLRKLYEQLRLAKHDDCRRRLLAARPKGSLHTTAANGNPAPFNTVSQTTQQAKPLGGPCCASSPCCYDTLGHKNTAHHSPASSLDCLSLMQLQGGPHHVHTCLACDHALLPAAVRLLAVVPSVHGAEVGIALSCRRKHLRTEVA